MAMMTIGVIRFYGQFINVVKMIHMQVDKGDICSVSL